MLREVYRRKATSILEVGVYRGVRAMQMIETAALHRAAGDVRYYGFDLFEGLSDELLKSEFSKMPPPEAEVLARLQATGASIELHRGFSQETLPPFVEKMRAAGQTIDLAFIDGGHAEETIQADWNAVSQLMGPQSIVIFDDYYAQDYSQALGRVGCQYLIDALDRSVYDVQIWPTVDSFAKSFGTLAIQLAAVQLRTR
jgi:predicted O-methyltransferase YrrM